MNEFEELENFEEITTIELTNGNEECNEMTIEVLNLKEEELINDEQDGEDEKSATENSNKTDINSIFE